MRGKKTYNINSVKLHPEGPKEKMVVIQHYYKKVCTISISLQIHSNTTKLVGAIGDY
ncbi:hypothetical protein SLEP1_g37839 [Rubroshorea leprosula]|uniref:Uncharacterized protein n=1 Tax=Rubroshorea leprosula TaxID=152421 RepID=A0AAV5KW90_9ROSI|nr:hypothetical protein SLEP1_g37839 [Rubroshorea leprosula]